MHGRRDGGGTKRDGWMHGCMDAWMDGVLDGWRREEMEGRMEARMQGWMDGRMREGIRTAYMHGVLSVSASKRQTFIGNPFQESLIIRISPTSKEDGTGNKKMEKKMET